jgi:hypothetical protein
MPCVFSPFGGEALLKLRVSQERMFFHPTSEKDSTGFISRTRRLGSDCALGKGEFENSKSQNCHHFVMEKGLHLHLEGSKKGVTKKAIICPRWFRVALRRVIV